MNWESGEQHKRQDIANKKGVQNQTPHALPQKSSSRSQGLSMWLKSFDAAQGSK